MQGVRGAAQSRLLTMKNKLRKQDLMIIAFAALAVMACFYYPVPTWMLVFAVFILLIAIIGAIGNLGLFGPRR